MRFRWVHVPLYNKSVKLCQARIFNKAVSVNGNGFCDAKSMVRQILLLNFSKMGVANFMITRNSVSAPAVPDLCTCEACRRLRASRALARFARRQAYFFFVNVARFNLFLSRKIGSRKFDGTRCFCSNF